MTESRQSILYVDHFPDIGGGQVSLLTRLDHLDRTKWRPIVAVSETEGELHNKLAERDVKVVPTPFNFGDVRTKNEKDILKRPTAIVGNVATVLRAGWHLVRTIRRYDIDLVHSNSFKGAVLAAFPARVSGVPFVFHARSSRAYSDHGLLDHYVCAAATRIVANSSFTADTFGHWNSKATVIHSPVDTDYFDLTMADGEDIRSELGVGTAPLVGHIGRLTPRKRQVDVVSAIPKIQANHPDVEVLFVGGTYEGLDDGYVDRVKRTADDRSVSDVVQFLGYRDDVRDIIDALDVLVLPSLKEPMGRVVVETLLMETPVVASNSGGIPEIVSPEETGLLVPERDPDALAAAVTRVLDDLEWARTLAERGRQTVQKRFHETTITNSEETLYEELLSS